MTNAAFRVPATVFSRGFGGFQKVVHEVGIIEVTIHGRVAGAYISLEELEHFYSLKNKERQVFHVSEIDDDLLTMIENAKYGEASE